MDNTVNRGYPIPDNRETFFPDLKAMIDAVDLDVDGVSGGGMSNPMTTLGDIIRGGASGAPGRLGIGSAGQVLTVVSGEPAWAALPTLDADLSAIAALTGTGFATRTASDTWAQRSLVAPAAGFTITNPAGIAGDPTFVLANDLLALEGLGSTGFAVRTATDTWAQRVITGTANQITVANGGGVSGNPTLSIPASAQLSVAKLTNLTSDGFIKTSASDGTLSIDTNTYLTGNQTITLSGDVSGSGSAAITTTIGAAKVTNAMLAGSIDPTKLLVNTDFLFTANQSISNTAPALALTDTTASAKSLTIAVDSNIADFRESAGASGSGLAIDLSNGFVGLGTATHGGFRFRVVKDQNANTAAEIANATDGTAARAALSITASGGGTGFNACSPSFTTISSWANSTVLFSTFPGLNLVALNAAGFIRFAVGSSTNITTTEKMRLTVAGNLGIGTTTPRKLADFLSTSQSQLRLTYTDNSVYSDFTVGSGGNLTIAPTGDLVFDPTGNDLLPATGYDLNLGSLTNKYLTVHAAELWVETLIAQDTMATTAGRLIVPKGATVLSADLLAAGTTITVKHNNLASGDRIWMESNGKFEMMAVTSGAGGSAGFYTYSVTRNLDTSGANDWYAGDSVVNTGTTGDGYIEMYAYAGRFAGTGPTITGNVRNSATYNDISTVWALGNLNGLYGYGSTTYGVGFGKYAAGVAHITIDSTNGYRAYSGLSTVRIQLANDGSGFLANSLISWDTSGNFNVAGNATIGGFTIGSDYIRDNANSFGMASTVSGGDDVRFWAGDTFANRATAPFRVTEAGVATMTSGAIGGWTVDATSIRNAASTVMLRGAGNLAFGATPPTSATVGTGLFVDSGGMVGLASNVQQAIFDATTGRITAGVGRVRIDREGIHIRTPSGSIAGDPDDLTFLALEDNDSGRRVGLLSGQDQDGSIFLSSGSSVNPGAASLMLQAFYSSAPIGDITVRLAASSGAGSLRIYSGGTLGVIIGADTAPTAMLDIVSDKLRLRTAKTPATAGATGNQGDFCWDAAYLYICTATNTWRRVAHATW